MDRRDIHPLCLKRLRSFVHSSYDAAESILSRFSA